MFSCPGSTYLVRNPYVHGLSETLLNEHFQNSTLWTFLIEKYKLTNFSKGFPYVLITFETEFPKWKVSKLNTLDIPDQQIQVTNFLKGFPYVLIMFDTECAKTYNFTIPEGFPLYRDEIL